MHSCGNRLYVRCSVGPCLQTSRGRDLMRRPIPPARRRLDILPPTSCTGSGRPGGASTWCTPEPAPSTLCSWRGPPGGGRPCGAASIPLPKSARTHRWRHELCRKVRVLGADCRWVGGAGRHLGARTGGPGALRSPQAGSPGELEPDPLAVRIMGRAASGRSN